MISEETQTAESSAVFQERPPITQTSDTFAVQRTILNYGNWQVNCTLGFRQLSVTTASKDLAIVRAAIHQPLTRHENQTFTGRLLLFWEFSYFIFPTGANPE